MNRRAALPLLGGVATLLCSTALTRLYAGFGWWFWPSALGTLVAVLVGTALRRLRVPLPAHPIVYAAGLLVTATLLGAHTTAWGGLIPTGRSIDELRSLATDGRTDIRSLAAPVPHRPGLVLLTVLGVYLVAALVDAIAVTLRRGSLAGLPLLGLFAVPTAVLSRGVGVLPFLLGAAGYIALLLAEGRDLVTGWGRPLSTRPGTREAPAGSMLGTTGRRIGIAALAVAALVPALIPGLGPGLFSPGGSGVGTGNGPSSANVVQPIVEVAQQLHSPTPIPLLRIKTDKPGDYLRLTALERFDGQRFTLGRIETASTNQRVQRALHGYTGSAPTTPVRLQVTVGNLDEHYLPVPDNPEHVSGLHGDWRLFSPTSTIYSAKNDTRNVTYTVTSEVPTPSPQQLPTAIGPVPAALAVDTSVPRTLDPNIPRLARQIVAQAHAVTDGQKVLAIQRYLTGPLFTYDLQGAPTTENGALSKFLFVTRRGYCEQFASAMAVLVRTLGLPSRVAIGFTTGTAEPDGTRLITSHDAHAWPEVWFGTAGWLRFEPTKSGGQVAVSTPSYATTPDTPADQTQGQVAQPDPVPSKGSLADQKGVDNSNPSDSSARLDAAKKHSGGLTPLELALIVVAGVVLLAPALVRLGVRRRRLGGFGRSRSRRGGGPGESGPEAAVAVEADSPAGPGALARTRAAWRELLDLAADLGFPIRRSDSPRAAAARLGDSLPDGDDARSALQRLADAEERARYAPRDAPLVPAGQLAADVRSAGRSLRRTVGVRRRVRATVAPPSVVGRVRLAASRGVADALDTGDRAVARAAAGLSRLSPRHRR